MKTYISDSEPACTITLSDYKWSCHSLVVVIRIIVYIYWRVSGKISIRGICRSPSVEAQLGTCNSLLYLFNHLVSELPQCISHVSHVFLHNFYIRTQLTTFVNTYILRVEPILRERCHAHHRTNS